MKRPRLDAEHLVLHTFSDCRIFCWYDCIVSDSGRKSSLLDSLPSPTRRVSQAQLEVIVETGGSSLDRGLRRARQIPEDLLKDTIETDNKRRPAVQRENRVRYGLDQQTYYPDDSQSGSAPLSALCCVDNGLSI